MSPPNQKPDITPTSRGDQSTLPEQVTTESELQQQAWELLEFTNVRALLAERTRFFMSREMAIKAEPLLHMEDVERLQEETAQAVLMLSTVGDIGLTGTRDPRTVLKRAAIDGMLTGEEIVSILFLLASIWTARNTVVSMKG